MREWWKKAIIYQIYPRSYQDSNGDGVGDLPGIISRLDHLVMLGCDAVWLSPIYPSPMRDFGYDVSDYCGIDPTYGTLEQFDALVSTAHDRGLRVILDFVPNHTSDLHPWFQESKTSRGSARRDWYVWRDPAPDGGPPNNWLGAHGGCAWSFDEQTGQYYLHSFLPEMPDLNWDNPAVREAIHESMRFWLERGVDGFRVDVILRIAKDPSFADEPANPAYTPDMPDYDSLLHTMTRDTEFVHAYIRETRALLDQYDALLIGETYLPPERLALYYGQDDECHLPFNFGLVTEEFTAQSIAACIQAYLRALPEGAWPNWVLGNHDVARVASRVGAGDAGAKLAHLLLLTLPGTITMYAGDELGMENGEIPPHLVVDRRALSDPERWFNRDRARTPMQWDDSPTAGFTTGNPWLPVGPDFAAHNVERERGNPASVLEFVRAVIRLRREHQLWENHLRRMHSDAQMLVYSCTSGAEFLVALNLSNEPAKLPDRLRDCSVVLSGGAEAADPPPREVPQILAPWQGVVLLQRRSE
jgi:alpha-glucosidase